MIAALAHHAAHAHGHCEPALALVLIVLALANLARFVRGGKE